MDSSLGFYAVTMNEPLVSTFHISLCAMQYQGQNYHMEPSKHQILTIERKLSQVKEAQYQYNDESTRSNVLASCALATAFKRMSKVIAISPTTLQQDLSIDDRKPTSTKCSCRSNAISSMSSFASHSSANHTVTHLTFQEVRHKLSRESGQDNAEDVKVFHEKRQREVRAFFNTRLPVR
jgi:hypothetical protein